MIKKLLNAKMKLTKNQKGLTLIELLVVIVILGIIAAIAIPMISSQRANAEQKAAEQTNAIVKDAAQRYVATSTSYTSGAVVFSNISAEFAQTPTCPENKYKVNESANLLTDDYCIQK
jgi:prepilin-type N-terminal cleavage/methylation domain-containing protein